jgi:hypothetical protein
MTESKRWLMLMMAVFGLIIGVSGQASADITTTFNQTISSFDPPGSSGETTNGFEVTTDSSTGNEIGLRISIRFSPTPASQTNNGTIATYTASTGLSSPPPANAAVWNIDYFALPGGSGTFGTGAGHYTAALTLYGLNGSNDGTLPLTAATNPSAPGSPRAAQDSTNLGYLGLPAAVYNPNVPGTYRFILTLTPPSGGGAVLTEEIDLVVASPEPSTFAMAATAGLSGLAYSWRRRKRTA